MVKSAKSHLDEEDDADGYDSSSYRGEVAKVDGKSSEQKTNTHRSKHSETEQRRRSKINERFQILRDLIPQNDQKRDKASFLLEVIEYIQFLQEKLQMYEGPYHGWGQEPTKLTPWKNHPPADGLLDHSQVLKNDSAHESTAMLTNVHSSIESDLGTSAVPFNLQLHPHILTAGKSGVTAQPVQESLSDAENIAFLPQSQQWHSQPYATECDALNNTSNGQEEHATECDALNNTSNGQEEPPSETGAVSISSTYSQGILDSLTQALRSSGVDLSQTNISVQIDVSKQESSIAASSSKNQGNPFSNNQVTEDSQARKRSRRGKS